MNYLVSVSSNQFGMTEHAKEKSGEFAKKVGVKAAWTSSWITGLLLKKRIAS